MALQDGTIQTVMDSEERPSKMRKVSHHEPITVSGDPDGTGPMQMHDAGAVNHDAGDSQSMGDRGDAAAFKNIQNDRDSVPLDDLPPPSAVEPPLPTQYLDEDGNPLSKNQAKKLRKKLEWESKREDRKVIRKEKVTAKRERRRAARQAEAEPGTGDNNQAQNTQQPKKTPPQRAVQLPVTFLVDCDFDNLMRDNERISLASQITRCYSDNKNSLFRAHLAICSFGGKLRERFDGILGHYTGWRGVRFLDEDFVKAAEAATGWMTMHSSAEDGPTGQKGEEGGELKGVFSKYAAIPDSEKSRLKAEGEIVYLTSDSPHTLTELKPYSTYIIGGLVDKNREKGICYKRARAAAELCEDKGTTTNIKTAKLPIGEYLEMSSRKVLATNHVNEIMLKWLECGDWGEAFMQVIPKRKGGQLKDQGAGEKGGEVESDGTQVGHGRKVEAGGEVDGDEATAVAESGNIA